MGTRIVTATEFKTKGSELLTEVEQGGEPITITRRGRPVAVLEPAKRASRARKSPMNSLARKGKVVGDIVNFSAFEYLKRK
jgi:prevent-host-death family protein